MSMEHIVLMEDLDEIDKRLDALISDNRNLRAENLALAERLRQSDDMRDVVGELRALKMELDRGMSHEVNYRLVRLLRRLDRESQ